VDANLLDGDRIGEERHPLVTFPIGSDGCIKKNGKRSGEQIGKEPNRESSGWGSATGWSGSGVSLSFSREEEKRKRVNRYRGISGYASVGRSGREDRLYQLRLM
jgi:hypothetical protein